MKTVTINGTEVALCELSRACLALDARDGDILVEDLLREAQRTDGFDERRAEAALSGVHSRDMAEHLALDERRVDVCLDLGTPPGLIEETLAVDEKKIDDLLYLSR